MNIKLILFLGIFIFLYGLIHYYIGLRGWQLVDSLFSNPRLLKYWIAVMIFLSLAYPLSRYLTEMLPRDAALAMMVFSSYWLAVMFYLLLTLLALDIIRLINKLTHLVPLSPNVSVAAGLTVIIIVAGIVIYGSWNANHPIIKNYQVTLNKKNSSLTSLKIAVVSDIHLGWINGLKQMQHMTGMVNELNPDLIILPGDVIDEGIDMSTEEKIPEALKSLHPGMGIYAVMGNHEYISGNADKVKGYLQKGGVTVLRDEWVNMKDSFYLVGRDDRSGSHYRGTSRPELNTVMAGIEKDQLPILLLDHQPSGLQQAEQAGVDLQISGHTHRGQIWPVNYITHAIFEQDWGYLQKSRLQLIVSCGYGTWGPPIRVGNRPEIVNIEIKFEPDHDNG